MLLAPSSLAMCFLPSPNNRCPTGLSSSLPSDLWWAFYIVNGDEVVMRVQNEVGPITIAIPIDREVTNLPIVCNSFVSEKVKNKLAHKFRSSLIATKLHAALDYFADTIN